MKDANNRKGELLLATYTALSIFLISCGGNDYIPKPRGYFRIDLPEKTYQIYSNNNCPYTFEFPVYAAIVDYTNKNSEPCWINLDFPKLKGKIHISYKKVNNNVARYMEDARTFVYKHTIKAESISEQPYLNEQKKVYGILYYIEGNAASPVQFFLTDSTKNFLRGALYFNVQPNKDSLDPVTNFIKKDISHLIETFEWK